MEKKGREKGGRRKEKWKEQQEHCEKRRENQWEQKDWCVTRGLHVTPDFGELSASSSALWKVRCFINVPRFPNVTSTIVMVNSIIRRGNVIRPSSSAGTTGPTRGRRQGSGALRPAVPSRGCKEEGSWGRNCTAGKNKAPTPREIGHVIITVSHSLHLLLKQWAGATQQKRQLEGLFVLQQWPEEIAGWLSSRGTTSLEWKLFLKRAWGRIWGKSTHCPSRYHSQDAPWPKRALTTHVCPKKSPLWKK